ncbi:MAG: hypothetical protein IJK64_06085 [Clostridia bacterium]|nr:hypothetical protein [Clostridia bacterium]
MKKLKAIISILLVICIFASSVVMASAKGVNSEGQSSLENVATMYLCVSNGNPRMPHMWIYILNTSDTPLDVAGYRIKPGSALSMGCFTDRGSGEGIHFNLERYWVKDATYDRTFCMSTQVSRGELDSVVSLLKRHNYWNYMFNCAWFAVSVWNTCSPRKMIYLFAPQIERVIMLVLGARRPTIKFQKLYDESLVLKYSRDGLTPVNHRVVLTNTGI